MCEVLLNTWTNIEILWMEGGEAALNHFGKVLSAEERNRLQHVSNGNIKDDTRDNSVESSEWTFKEVRAYEGEDYYGDLIEEMYFSQNAEAGPSKIKEREEASYSEMEKEGEEEKSLLMDLEGGDEETPFAKGEYETEHYDELEEEREEVIGRKN